MGVVGVGKETGAGVKETDTTNVVAAREQRGGRGRKRKETQAKKQLDELAALKMFNKRAAGKKKDNGQDAAKVEKAEEEEKMVVERNCECGRPLPRVGQTTNGWEGSAVLYHGSVIQIGCFTLVFSVFPT